MMTLLVISVITALIFDLVNGFHDAANSIATVVSTRVLRPFQAVLWAAFFNFIAMFIFAPHVAETLSKIVIIQPNEITYVYLVFSGLLGAIIWDIVTWWLGLPTSSSHALIGGMAGAGIMCGGWEALHWEILFVTMIFIVLAPCIGFFIGIFLELIFSWLVRRQKPLEVDSWFRRAQLLSAGLYSIGHGANDAQKTMGIIMALLVAAGALHPQAELSLYNQNTMWIILSCQLMMAIGTAFGGWRIIRTMGMRITKLKPIGGFCAETAGATTLFMATCWGIPVSTTHTITGAIMGVGSLGSKVSAVRWGVATRILWAWILTIPAAASIAALTYYIIVKMPGF